MKNYVYIFVIVIFAIFYTCDDQNNSTSSWYYFDETYCSDNLGITNDIPNDELIPILSDYLDNKNIEVLDMEIFFNHSILQNCDSCQCKTGRRIRIHSFDENRSLLNNELFYYDSSLQTIIIPNEPIALNYDFECGVDSFFYYYNNESIRYLTLNPTKIVIVFTDSTSIEYLDYLALNSIQLDSIKYLWPTHYRGIAYGYLKDNSSCEDVSTALNTINSDTVVWSVNSIFTDDRYGDDKIFFNEVIVDKSTVDSKSQLLQLTEETHTKIIKETSLYFIVWTDKYSTGNALSIANYFYKTGYFDWATPSFLGQVVLH